MKADRLDLARLTDALEALRREVAGLGERVATLEAAGSGERGRVSAPSPPGADATGLAAVDPRSDAAGLSEELVLVISAAIAAFLGKKPHIRQIRLLGSAAWSQQGRVTIQASHALSVHHG